jgi:hypothetical protein
VLTDTAIRLAKARDRDYKLYDARGLYLQVTAAHGRLWRFKYHYQGKGKLLAVGQYPDLSLNKARERRDEARLNCPEKQSTFVRQRPDGGS